MKVLILSKYYPPHYGGIEARVQGVAEYLSEKGIEVEVLCSHTENERKEEMMNGVKVVRLPLLADIMSQPINPGMRRYVTSSDADVVDIHLPNPLFLLKTIGISKKTVYTYHSDIIDRPFLRLINAFTRWRLKKADAIVATSDPYAEESPVLKDMDVEVIPNFIDVEHFEYSPPKGKNILFIGRYAEYKGLDYLLEAFQKVLHQHKDARLIMVGDGKLREDFTQKAKSLGVNERIKYVTDAEDVRPYLNDCRMLVLPSPYKTEAFGIVQLEAMASGKPVISCNIPGSGVPWVNRDGETGIVVPPENADALAEAINTLLDDYDLARKMGAEGRARVKENFGLEDAAEKTLEVYRRVLQQ